MPLQGDRRRLTASRYREIVVSITCYPCPADPNPLNCGHGRYLGAIYLPTVPIWPTKSSLVIATSNLDSFVPSIAPYTTIPHAGGAAENPHRGVHVSAP